MNSAELREHVLKTDPAVFQAVIDGRKTFEIRYNDRDFRVGDALLLRETKYTGAAMREGFPLEYTGREHRATVSHVLLGPIYGLAEGWAILSLRSAALERLEALEAALRDFGWHSGGCPAENNPSLADECRCGYTAALEGDEYRWVAEFDDPRGRGSEYSAFRLVGDRDEALEYARSLYWSPRDVRVMTLPEWFEMCEIPPAPAGQQGGSDGR